MSALVRRHSLGLRARLTLVVVLGVSLVFAVLAGLAHLEASQAMSEARQQQILALSQAQAHQLASRLAPAQALPQALAASLGAKEFWREEELKELLRGFLHATPSVYGMAVALAPGFIPGQTRASAPYVYRGPQGLASLDLGVGDYNFVEQDWYLIPSLLGRPAWSEPYYDEGGGEVFMTTFSVPVFKEERLWAVVTADVRLDDLEQVVQQLPGVEGGRAVLLSRQGVFLASGDKEWSGIFSLAEGLARQDLRKLGKRMVAGQSGLAPITDWRDGQPAWLAFSPVEGPGWSYGVILGEDQVLGPIWRMARQQGFLALGGLLVLGLVVWGILLGVTRPLQRLAKAAGSLAAGDLSTRVEGVPPGDEVGDLAIAFNRMVSDLTRYLEEITAATAARQRIQSELDLAQQIQLAILPRTYPPFPERPEFDLFARTLPARQVGGDFYDFFLLDEDHLALVVADVSGKGVPAALFMTVTRTLIKNAAFHHREPAAVLAETNARLAPDNEMCLFVTVFYGLYQISSGRLRYACAGHPAPLLRLAQGRVEPLPQTPGMALGIMDEWSGQEGRMTLEPGQALLAYTDGLDEAENGQGQPLGLARVAAWLAAAPAPSAPGQLEALTRLWQDHTQGQEQFDDLTLLYFRRCS